MEAGGGTKSPSKDGRSTRFVDQDFPLTLATRCGNASLATDGTLGNLMLECWSIIGAFAETPPFPQTSRCFGKHSAGLVHSRPPAKSVGLS